MKNINRWIFKIPVEDIMDDKYDECGNDNPCICCGKHIKDQKFSVHLLTDGNIVSVDDENMVENSQGFFPIGTACKNKIPNNFYFKS